MDGCQGRNADEDRNRSALGTLPGMNQDMRNLGLFVGIVVAIGAAIFMLSGGDLGGKTTVSSDRDLPPVASR
jgi:hypothetical protein